ncbi:MAG: hypothetical protein UR78_C0002G0009 [Candidatus Moranbacteria bacterium GW2011_GWF2_35_39]|nr:MAG: hypothetical protein UR78_C0002G0009 [Candidatus Moranbacteria bacterium GW2011_GWF2_35_39]
MLHLLKKEINFKKIITIIFIAVLYFGFFVPKSKAVGIVDATLLFNPASTSVSAGSDFNLVARVDPGSNTVDGDGVNAVQLDITFDPDVLQLNSMVAAGTFTRLATPTIDNLLGTASAAFFIAGDDVITVSDVATLSFHAQASATDSPVAFATSANAAVSDGLGTQVVATRTPATVTVTGVSYTVGGTASGLNGTAVLQNNGGNDLNVTANTTFTFTNGLADGATYAVTILTQPTGQTCVLSDESGTISAANVDNVGLTCTTNTYTVTFDGNTSDGGSTATQTLDYNTPTALTANGYTKTGYTFDGWNTLANGTGTDYADEAEYTIGTANVTLYAQWVVNTYTVTFDGNTSDGGSTATQTLDYNTPTALTANGYTKTGYTFDSWNTEAGGGGTEYADEADYTIGTANVTLYAQWTVITYAVTYNGNSNTGGTAPADQTKTYAVDLTLQTNSGTLVRTGYTFDGWNTQADGGGTDYAVGATYTTNATLALYAKWTINTYTVTFDGNTSDGGSTATQTLDYNTPTALTANGYTKTGYTFDSWNTEAGGGGTEYADEAEYTIGTANVTLYAQWTVITYTVGGTATGLNGTAVLQNNGGDDLNVTGESFTFATGLANGATYAVTIETQPTGQTCTLSNDTGTINLANVTNVGLTCTENSYTVGGTITGLDDTVTLQNNAGDDLDVSVDGAFTFVTSIEHGDTYAVTVLTQPTGQTCSVSDGSGTMGGANVTDVEVTCADITYTIGGTASGLNGTAVLQNNAGDDLNVTEDGSFTFATGLADGATYAVTIETQPTGQTCTLSDESGTISAANVTDVELNCTDTAGPTRSAGSPSGSFSSKTKSKAISLTTNEDATCKYSTTSGTEYDSMTETFTTTGETSHSTTVTGLSSNHTYRYYVRCQGESSNVNSTDYAISFSVKKKSSSDEKEPEKRKLSTNKKVLQRGEVIIESGKRFSKNDYVQLYFQTRYGGAFYPPVTVKTSDKGTFSISYKIPWYKSPGIYKWYAVDLKTGRTSKQGRYIVQ